MDWQTLLSTEKLVPDEMEPGVFAQYPINEFEKDYNKIVSSAAFRRLQDKTQVFPLDKSDFVRTRLTHSIEVSTIARQLGIMISENTTRYRPADIRAEDADGISSVLLCAGLLHDLGNPPFGHFGETVIGDWFKENLSVILYKGQPLRNWLNEQMISDLEHFEGNAQALRILLKVLHRPGINLSKAIISTLVKYPTNSISFNSDDLDIKKHIATPFPHTLCLRWPSLCRPKLPQRPPAAAVFCPAGELLKFYEAICICPLILWQNLLY